MNPLVSIITPVFNSQEYLEETLKSVLNQTYPYWEHILVDDGSSDNSNEIIEQYVKNDNRFKLIKRDRMPKGRSTSRNIGISQAQGKYIIFLDSDDLLKSHCLEQRVMFMQQNPKLNFSIFQIEMFLPSGEIRNQLSTKNEDNYLYAFLTLNFPWNVTCPIWLTSFLRKHKLLFDENLSNLEDPLLHTQSLLIDNTNFKVLYQQEYIDCQYRVDYKPVNIKKQIKCTVYFFENVFPKLLIREDKYECLGALHIGYTTLLAHYSGQNKNDIYNNIDEIKKLNSFFTKNKLISRSESLKTIIFLRLLSLNLFEKSFFVKLLNGLNYKNFYNFTFKRFQEE